MSSIDAVNVIPEPKESSDTHKETNYGTISARFELIDQVSSFQDHLTDETNSPRLDLINQAKLLLNKILFRETLLTGSYRSLPLFFEKMHAEFGIRALLPDILRELNDRELVTKTESEWAAVIVLLRYFLNWYIRRSVSMALCTPTLTSNRARAFLFELSILHDREWGGVSGIEAVASAYLRGVLGDTLWLRVRLEQNGKLLYAEKRWEEWKEGVLGLHAIQSNRTAALAHLVPILPDRQSVFLDRLSAFLPYGAIDTFDEAGPLTVCAEIIDRKGVAIASEKTVTWLRIPPKERTERPIFSPMSRGIWSEDVVSLDRIYNLKSRGAADGRDIKVSFDLDILSRQGTALPRKLQAECRFLDHFGRSIPGELSAYQSEEGALLTTVPLKINRPVELFRNLAVTIPASAFGLEPGNHKLYCEVVIVADGGELLCGGIEPCVISLSAPEPPQAARQKKGFSAWFHRLLKQQY